MIRGNELLVLALWVIPTVLTLGHALRTPESVWASSQQSQIVWVVVVLLAPLLGPLLYLFVALPRLRAS